MFNRVKQVDRWLSNYPLPLFRDIQTLDTILDKLNGTSGPPLPPISMMPKWRASLFARLHHCLGGDGVNCSILYCPRLSEIPASVTGGVIYGNGVIKLAVARGKVKLYIRMQTLR